MQTVSAHETFVISLYDLNVPGQNVRLMGSYENLQKIKALLIINPNVRKHKVTGANEDNGMNRKKIYIYEMTQKKIRQTNELGSASSTAHDHADEFCKKKRKVRLVFA